MHCFFATFIFGVIPFARRYGNEIKAFRRSFKDQVIAPIVSFADNTLRYDAEAFITERDFTDSRLFVQGNEFRGDDLISGRAGETDFQFCEVESRYKDPFGSSRRNTNGRNRDKSKAIFHGIFFKAQTRYSLPDEIFIIPKMSRRKLKAHGINMQHLVTKSMVQPTVPSPGFKKYFTVHSANTVHRASLLSPAFINGMLELRGKLGKNIFLSCAGRTVYVAVSIYNSKYMRYGESAFFEPPFFRSLLNHKSYMRNLELIDAMISVAKMLDGVAKQSTLNNP